ncbi:hypothetical protein GCM10010191_78440 [Actinomadura vinacea]|uniref:Uncharacterized protein n=1 Tax=Actinomadura vinacea TaxID=115336 RepID=A0ABP5XFW8_9ACTN
MRMNSMHPLWDRFRTWIAETGGTVDDATRLPDADWDRLVEWFAAARHPARLPAHPDAPAGRHRRSVRHATARRRYPPSRSTSPTCCVTCAAHSPASSSPHRAKTATASFSPFCPNLSDRTRRGRNPAPTTPTSGPDY